MTYAEAKRAVAGKLIFGDPVQLAAIHWLREFEQLKHAVMNCPGPHFGMDGQEVRIPAIGSCSCVGILWKMDDSRADEMIVELGKYLDFKSRQKK